MLVFINTNCRLFLIQLSVGLVFIKKCIFQLLDISFPIYYVYSLSLDILFSFNPHFCPDNHGCRRGEGLIPIMCGIGLLAKSRFKP